MINFLKSWIGNIVAIVIFISILEIVFPIKNMGKYVKMITGLIVMITMLRPFIFLQDNINDFINKTGEYEAILSASDYAGEEEVIENYNNEKVISLYKEMIEQSIVAIVTKNNADTARHDIVLDKDGNIEKIDVYLSTKDKKEILSIETINININKDIISETDEYILDKSSLAEEIRKDIGIKLDIDIEAINIYNNSKD